MRKWWLKFGCFLIGYNYAIIASSSEVSAKAVKRYTSALLIVCTLWAFIGYFFTERYIHGGTWGSLTGAFVFITIIVQIERQIILSHNPSKWLYVSRGLIAALMAILGAIIIDQIIFKEDIELEKITFIEERIKKALPPKTEELHSQIATLDTDINKKETERENLITDIAKKPMIPIYSVQTGNAPSVTTDSAGRPTTKMISTRTTTSSMVPNPKTALIAPLDESIKNLRNQKAEKDSILLNIRPQLEKEISAKTGFLDELKVMYSLIKASNVALLVWLIWFFFLMGLEMLVLISKMNEKENDYEKTVTHHMELQKKRLDLLYAKASENI